MRFRTSRSQKIDPSWHENWRLLVHYNLENCLCLEKFQKVDVQTLFAPFGATKTRYCAALLRISWSAWYHSLRRDLVVRALQQKLP